ncbi:hypothetical protein QBC39DRAFT_433635 [Podospora conica]|nr:hypothetical protein QBC39DRAFT_433635 [Schizothecium conicum]
MASMEHIYTGDWLEHVSNGTPTRHLTLPDTEAFALVTLITLIIPLSIKSLWKSVCLVLWPKVSPPLNAKPDGYTVVIIESFNIFRARAYGQARVKGFLIFIFAFTWVCIAASIAVPIGLSVALPYNEETPIVRTSGTIQNMVILRDPLANHTLATLRNLNLTLAAAEYYQSCYVATTPVGCRSNLVSPRLTWDEKDLACPSEGLFTDDLCVDEPNANLRLEFDLGINTASRFHFKKAMECGILPNATFAVPERTAEQLWQDYRPEWDDLLLSFGTSSVFKHMARHAEIGKAHVYKLAAYRQDADAGTGFDKRLLRADGAVTALVMEGQSISYLEPIEDPMFSAVELLPDSLRLYRPELQFRLAVCVDQYQVCNNATGRCTGWTSPLGKELVGDALISHGEDQIASWVLTYALEGTDLASTIAGRGPGALQAQRVTSGGTVLQPPSFKEEVRGWFGVSLAKLQLQILAMGHPTSFLDPAGFDSFSVRYPGVTLTEVSDICSRVLSREGEFTNLDFNGFIGTLVAFLIIWIGTFGHRMYRRLAPRGRSSTAAMEMTRGGGGPSP